MTIADYLKIVLVYLAIFAFIVVLYRAFSAIEFAKRNRNFLIAFFSLMLFSALFVTESLWRDLLFQNGTSEIAYLALKVLWWIALSLTANQFLDFFLWNGLLKKDGELVIPILLKQTISLFVYLFFAAGILHFVFEQPITPLLATSGVVAIVLGYSAQSTLSDVFGGLSLGLTRIFEKGDWIVVNDQLGQVVDMNWRVVTFVTELETELTIPNSVVAKSKIVNYSRPVGYRADVLFIHIERDAPIDAVKSCILKAAADSDLILNDPPPEAGVYEYGPRGVVFRLFFYTKMPFLLSVRNQLYSGLWYGLRRAGISIFHEEISIVESTKNDLQPDPLEELKPMLKVHQIFSIMTNKEIDQLSLAAKRMAVGGPEVMVRQGQESASLYIIASGSLGVYIDIEGGGMQNVATLGPSNLFGEISLLTGDLCNATVRSDSEAVVYRIDRDDLRPVFEARPKLIDRLSEMMAQRLEATDKAKEELAAKSKSDKQDDSLANRLAGRIKELFSI
ncbi:MAG: mechanosensitive ion channel family protein [Rhizobiaceae bacterium]